jgi:hypothetical protein
LNLPPLLPKRDVDEALIAHLGLDFDSPAKRFGINPAFRRSGN